MIITNETEPTPPTDGFANCKIWLTGRLMLLCHHHALAVIDLADGNSVKLTIEPLEIEDFGSECRACMVKDS